MTADPITLTDAQAWLRDRVADGETCPCCTQFAKVYRRKLTSAAAQVLIRMHIEGGLRWVHVPSFGAPGGDALKARYWGLIEERPVSRDDGSARAGWWRLTPAGQQFVLGLSSIPKYARIYDGRLMSLDGSETCTIRDALGNRFNYDDLMAGI